MLHLQASVKCNARFGLRADFASASEGLVENPDLMRLTGLHALETIAGKVERLTVHNGTEGLMTDLVKSLN